MPQFVPPHEPHNAADGAEFGNQEQNLDHHYEHHWEQPPYVEPIPQFEQPPPQYNYQQQPQEQERMNKELIDLKKWQVSETVGRNGQSNKIMEAWNEQRGYMEGVSKQMKNWTRNASARECYDIWAHQQLNPNLVEMPVTKLVRLIYDNCDKKRPAFLGCLKSNHEAGSSSQAAPPTTPTAAPTSAATATTTPAPAPAQQHDQDDYYPEQFFQK
ncbi:hypothetical protein PIB30_111187 [Stylosanthes scabra]|uniref:Uncharacterized protein n=1 Tax=Stylosanthes scabra TaxID=79078 RepID=A0ABU6R1V1_9FABA|nr:hypothetical protein [Stylosanthes scabra]